MKYSLTIEVRCESKEPHFFEVLADCDQPVFEFDRLDDLIAFLSRVADAGDETTVREYAEQVKLEGEATEKVVRRWGNRKAVTLAGEVRKAIAAAADKSEAAAK